MNSFLCGNKTRNSSEHSNPACLTSLKKLDFKVFEIKSGECLQIATECEELVCIISSGRFRVSFNKELAEFCRKNPFEDLPCGVYLYPFCSIEIENIGSDLGCFYIVKVAVRDDFRIDEKPILIKPEDIAAFSRGKGSYFRTIRNIIDEDFPAHSLLCGETINPPGHWSSFPPHKHDSSRFDNESEHEEIYYHLFSPSEGWGYQEIYSPEKKISQTLRIENKDIVAIPYGYHPVVSAPGHTLCYFWALAGDSRKLKMKDDERYSWIHQPGKITGRPYHKIVSTIPHSDSVDLLRELEDSEPSSMLGQPPVIWERAQGFQVFDPYGNVFIDFSSGVLIANTGHNHPKVNQAILDQVSNGLLSSYIFPNRSRMNFVKALKRHIPFEDSAVLLMSTGSEAVESCIKLAKTYGMQTRASKKIIVSFENAFHGRTLGAQLAGGIPDLKKWIGSLDPSFVQVPFPDNVHCLDLNFSSFTESLEAQNIHPNDVCGVLVEPYQGGVVSFAPQAYMQQLRKWCDVQNALLIMDEVQSGFCRTGKWWGFDHYGIVPDLIACGKGISSSLPLSAVIGTKNVLNLHPPGAMSTTHSANPVSCAAGTACIEVLEEEELDLNACKLEKIILSKSKDLTLNYPSYIRGIYGKGLVFAIHIQDPHTLFPSKEFAKKIVWNCAQKGLLLFAPVGTDGATIKICPPLSINSDALEEGFEILKSAFEAVCDK